MRDAVFVAYVSINAYTLVVGNWRKQSVWKTQSCMKIKELMWQEQEVHWLE